MTGRQSANVAVNAGVRIVVRKTQQKISEEFLIECSSARWNREDRLHGIAEYQYAVTVGIKKRARSGEVAECDQLSLFRLPNNKGQIAIKFEEPGFTEFREVLKNQMLATCVRWHFHTVLRKFADNFVAAIAAHVTQQPSLAIQRARLACSLRSRSGS